MQEKQTIVDYLNDEMRVFAERTIHDREIQVKAFKDAKHRRRKTLRQEKSEFRRKGDARGFEKTDPKSLDDSELPKVVVTKEEVELAT